MNPIVGVPATGWTPPDKNGYFTVLSKDNRRVLIPQSGIGKSYCETGIANNCTNATEPYNHVYHIRTGNISTETLPKDVGNIAEALNYQVHVSLGALEYCNLIYHTLIGSLKDQPANKLSTSPDLSRKLEDLQKQVEQLSSKVSDIRLSQKDIDQISSNITAKVQGPTSENLIKKLEDLQKQVEQLSGKVCDIRLSRKDIDQISSQIGVVVSAEDIASRIKVPSARDITEEIGELSLNEFTKSDLVNRITKLIPVSGVAKDIADRIVIPPFKVPTAAEIASHIQIPSAGDLASKIEIDYSRIASEVANRINILPGAQSIDISSLAKQIADHIPKFDIPTAEQIASQIRLEIPTAQEIANKLAEIKPDIILPVVPSSAPDYGEKINEIDRKCDDIIGRLHGEVG